MSACSIEKCFSIHFLVASTSGFKSAWIYKLKYVFNVLHHVPTFIAIHYGDFFILYEPKKTKLINWKRSLCYKYFFFINLLVS